MKAWKKTPPELVAAFDEAVPESPAVTSRPMFGYASAFANGNMFAGTFQDSIVVRLSETDRAALLKLKGAVQFEPMAGRPMKEYVVIPSSVVAKPKELAAWVERGHRYALTLPAKSAAKKPSVAKKTSAAIKSVRAKQATAKQPAAKRVAKRR